MVKKRFVDDGVEDIENQSLTDNLTGKTYWIDNGLDEIVDLLNELDSFRTQFEDYIRSEHTKCIKLRKKYMHANIPVGMPLIAKMHALRDLATEFGVDLSD